MHAMHASMPCLQVHWLRAILRFWNDMRASDLGQRMHTPVFAEPYHQP